MRWMLLPVASVPGRMLPVMRFVSVTSSGIRNHWSTEAVGSHGVATKRLRHTSPSRGEPLKSQVREGGQYHEFVESEPGAPQAVETFSTLTENPLRGRCVAVLVFNKPFIFSPPRSRGHSQCCADVTSLSDFLVIESQINHLDVGVCEA